MASIKVSTTEDDMTVSKEEIQDCPAVQDSRRRKIVETRVKNRRLEALKRLAIEGEYFSELEMKRRNPLLYEELVGRFLTQEEKKERDNFNYSEATLSGVLLEKYDRDVAQKLLEQQIDEYDAAVEEEDEDEQSDEEYTQQLWGESNQRKTPKREEKSEIEKKMLFEEFRSHMYSNFLQGKDDFDYSAVDTNADYDDLDELARDEEERYFNSESPTPMEEEQREETTVPDPLDLYMQDISRA